MKNLEIKAILDRSKELFISAYAGGNVDVMLAFEGGEEQQLINLASVLDEQLSSDGCYLEVSLVPGTKKCHLMLSMPGIGNPILLEPLRFHGADVDKLVEKEQNGETVGLGFYIYSKEFVKSEAEIEVAMAAEDYDEHQVVPADAPTYDSVKIPIRGGLKIKADVA